MKPANTIPISMTVPSIGQQPQFDIRQAVPKKCECGYELFDKTFRVGLISKMAIGNRTGMDIVTETVIYVCRECGKSLNMLAGGGQTEFTE